MSSVILGGAYDVSRLMVELPMIKVQSGLIGGSIYLPETTVTLRYCRGMFDGATPTFRTEVPVEILDVFGAQIFAGKIKSIKVDNGRVTLTCNSTLADMLGGIVDYSASSMHPADILAGFLDSIKIKHRGIATFSGRYPAMVATVVAPSAANVRTYDFIGRLADMLTMDLAVENDVVVGFDRTVPYTGYRIEQAMSYPTLTDDGTSRAFRGVKFGYAGGDGTDLEAGDITKTTWNPDYSDTSVVQCVGLPSAQAIATARLAKYGAAHPVYQLQIRRDHAPVILGAWQQVYQGTLQGNYRTVGYQTDGEVYWLDLEAE